MNTLKKVLLKGWTCNITICAKLITIFIIINCSGYAATISGNLARTGVVNPLKDKSRDYKFKNKISRQVLENYLDRSITMQNLLTDQQNFDDNLRMIKNIGAKF
ncbi:MAG: hypothetical protein JWR67_15, partial [Mucilaginibacter sp.]|nr:hypothetical protein [Mucilaginibacter sp.]